MISLNMKSEFLQKEVNCLTSSNFRNVKGKMDMAKNITESWFIQGIAKATHDAWLKGWNECNGGNISIRLLDEDIYCFSNQLILQPRYISLKQTFPLLSNVIFLISGTGKFFRNIKNNPSGNVGIIKMDTSGSGYYILWGLDEKALPTSELSTHLLSHQARFETTSGKDRIIMHCHATNLIALTYILEHNTALITRKLWECSTECLVVFPEGISIIPWQVPGTRKIGESTSHAMKKHSLVLWPFHGIFASGSTFDSTFGLIDTAEKSAEILVKILSTKKDIENTINREQLILLSQRFGVTPLKSALDIY